MRCGCTSLKGRGSGSNRYRLAPLHANRTTVVIAVRSTRAIPDVTGSAAPAHPPAMTTAPNTKTRATRPERGQPSRRRSPARICLRRLRFELVPNEGLVTDHPRIVARRDEVRVAGSYLGLRAVVLDDVHASSYHRAQVPGLAAVGAGHRLDALRPAPARLRGESGGLHIAELYHVELRLVRATAFVRCIETFLDHRFRPSVGLIAWPRKLAP